VRFDFVQTQLRACHVCLIPIFERLLMANSSKAIPEQFHDQIAAMPECGYGVSRVTVTLDDGTRYGDVFIAWGEEIVKVGISETIPFDPMRIVKIEKS